MNIEEMNLEELEAAINQFKARLSEEGVSDEERREIDLKLKDLQDRLDLVMQQVYQAARRGADLPPEAMPY